MVDYQEFRKAAANADIESLNEFILNGVGRKIIISQSQIVTHNRLYKIFSRKFKINFFGKI